MSRTAQVTRKTNETEISVSLTIDGTGKADIQTGIGFLDHMLEQLARHSLMDITLHVHAIHQFFTDGGNTSRCLQNGFVKAEDGFHVLAWSVHKTRYRR